MNFPNTDFGIDINKNAKMLGRLKLPYKSFNFLSLLTRQYGASKYDSARDLIELSQWMYVHVSDIRNIINRLAEYAITDMQIDDTDNSVPKDQQTTQLNLLNKIGLKNILLQAAKLFYATGNVLLSIENRFKKHLECPKCESIYNIQRFEFRFDTKNINYIGKCLNKECNYKGPMNVLDIKSRSPENIKIKIWDWHDIQFNYNSISDEYQYYHRIPEDMIKGFLEKEPDKFLLETTPHFIIKDIFTKKRLSNRGVSDKFRMVAFLPGKIKHLKNDSVMSSVMGGWGEPLTIGVLQDAFFMQLLRQAQAVLLADFIIPIRVVSPDPAAVNMMDLGDFAKKFDELYAQFQKDPMQIMKAPFPIQYQTMTGEGKTLLLTNEMEATRNSIRRGTGVPAELLDGGLQNMSGGTISLRMLENFLGNFVNSTMTDLVNNFIIPNICIILKMPAFRINFAKFKNIDDVQQKQAKLNLYDRNLLSDTDIYNDYEMPRPSEDELIKSVERKGRRDGKYQLLLQDYQAEGQSVLMRKQNQVQMDIQAAQIQEQQIMAAKQSDPNADGMPLTEADTPANAGVGKGDPNKLAPTGENLQPPEQLGDYALSQLHGPDEINSFMEVLKKQMPNNQQYVQQVGDYINKSSGGGAKNAKTTVTNSDTRPRQKDGKVDMRPNPLVKPPRRKT